MPGVTYTLASLFGTFMECVMYGVFVPLFIAACYVQSEKYSRQRSVNRFMAFSTVFFGLSVTTNLVISLYQAVRAISHTPSGVSTQLSIGPPPTEQVVWFVILQLQVMLADIIIVYRMYHIYDRNPFVCVLPSISIAALFVAGCGVTDQLRNPGPDPEKLNNWSMASFCLMVFNSFFLTALISFRLWRVHRETRRVGIQVGGSIILRAMKVLIESAALWTTFATMNFAAYLAKSNLSYTFLAMSGPSVGISFCLIIVRLGHTIPEARDETWGMPVTTQMSRTRVSKQVSVSFPQAKIRRDVYSRQSGDFHLRTLESQEQGYLNFSAELPKIFRSPPPSPLLHEAHVEGL